MASKLVHSKLKLAALVSSPAFHNLQNLAKGSQPMVSRKLDSGPLLCQHVEHVDSRLFLTGKGASTLQVAESTPK
jgi:hypothetical protein